MRPFLLSTSALALLAGTQAAAQTSIDAKQTTAVRTSTVKAGAADSVRITANGSVTPPNGTAVTIDSNNSVTNGGTVQVTGADEATGIFAQAGVRGDISNTGKIIVDETYEPTDADKDGDLDGPFAQGSRRAGIRTAGAFTGAISNAGEIAIEGTDSAGIRLGGPLTGAFTHDGKTSVIGDRSVGIRLDSVTSNVTIGGQVTAVGRDAVGVRLDGDVTGTLVVQGAVGTTGYRYTTAPAGTAKLDADDLLQGGSALFVGGNVTGGVLLAGTTGKAADIVTFGSAPAVQIGSATRAVTLGPVAATTPAAGLVVNGKVTASGVYDGASATALNLGGLGGTVTVSGGVSVGGTVQATAVGANATAIRLGSGATTPEVRVTGSVGATGTGASSQSTALLIDVGAATPTIRNGGTVKATAAGMGTAILDRSGTVTLVENAGSVAATGGDAARSVAIDLSANAAGAMVRQTAPASGAAAPSISGAIRFGAGDDVLEVAAGSVAGDVSFGSGAARFAMAGASTYAGTTTFGSGSDLLTLAGTSRFGGTANFVGGADRLTIADKAVFAGRLVNAAGLSVALAAGGGTFAPDGPSSIGSLDLGAQSILSVALDKANPAGNLIQVSGATTVGTGSQLALRVTGGADVAGRYVVLRSGTLTGVGNLTLSSTAVPFLYKGTLVNSAPTEITVDVVRKATTELGFDRAQAAAFDAIDAAIGSDAKVAAAVRGATDGVAFRASVDQLLPNYAGGVFESVTLGSRAFARHLQEPAGRFSEEGAWGVWLTPFGWDASKDERSTVAYDVRGWGLGGGLEHKTSAGNFGVSLAYLSGRDDEGVAANRIEHDQYELAGSWRGRWGGFAASARASAAWIAFEGRRRFDGVIGSEKVQRDATADWDGTLYSGAGSISYEVAAGRFSLRPVLALDYYRLNEDAYREAGGGKAVDLTVRKRRSDELALTASLAAGLNLGGSNRYDQWTRLEVEGGWREPVAGKLGRTTASFDSGTPFTLDPEARDGGWVGKVRAVTGTTEVRLSGEASAERRLGEIAMTARAALQFAF